MNKKVIAVTVNIKLSDKEVEDKVFELENLVNALEGEVLLNVIQNRDTIDKAYYIGKGKAQEIKDYCEKHEMMEILPHFCNMDHQMIQALQLYLIRSKTCSNGDDICEYTIVTNENPLVDNNPIFVKDDGLILTKKI